MFLGIDLCGLCDVYVDYGVYVWVYVLVNCLYCLCNLLGWKGYGENCWGLIVSDDLLGYVVYLLIDDIGMIIFMVVLGFFVFVFVEVMFVLCYLYDDLGDWLWGDVGFVDVFCLLCDWVV